MTTLAFPFDDAAPPPILPPFYMDRSLAEDYCDCPMKAFAIETGIVIGSKSMRLADAGTEAHRLIAEGVERYALRGMDPGEYFWEELPKVRPDTTERVREGLRYSLNSIANYLTARHPNDIVAFQGGPAEWRKAKDPEAPVVNRSGQVATELLPATATRGATVVTSEIDLLMAGGSPDELEEIDFKSGWTPFTAESVKASFQFRTHAFLLFDRHPDLKKLRVQVWMTGKNYRTGFVTFYRNDAESFQGKLLMAARYRQTVHAYADRCTNTEPKWLEKMDALSLEDGEPICWPDYDKCALCPACVVCPRATRPAIDLASDPVRYAQDTSTMKAALADREKQLRAYVDKHKSDIDIGDGKHFGHRKPKATKKPDARGYIFYQDKKADPPSERKAQGKDGKASA